MLRSNCDSASTFSLGFLGPGLGSSLFFPAESLLFFCPVPLGAPSWWCAELPLGGSTPAVPADWSSNGLRNKTLTYYHLYARRKMLYVGGFQSLVWEETVVGQKTLTQSQQALVTFEYNFTKTELPKKGERTSSLEYLFPAIKFYNSNYLLKVLMSICLSYYYK